MIHQRESPNLIQCLKVNAASSQIIRTDTVPRGQWCIILRLSTWYSSSMCTISRRKWYIHVYKSELHQFLILTTYPLVLEHSYRTSPFSMGKSAIPMAIFHSYVAVYQRVLITARLGFDDDRRRSELACCPTRSHHPKAAIGEGSVVFSDIIVQLLHFFISLLLYDCCIVWYLIVPGYY